MSPKPAIPVNPQWQDVARAVCADTPNLLDFYQRCKDCGIPVDDKIADTQADHDFMAKFLENFFPPDA